MGTSIIRVRFVAARVLLCAMAMQARAATITVINTNDSGPGSLRQALTIANDGDTITFAVTGIITLTSGGLVIDKSVTVSGPGADGLSVDGNQAPFQCVLFTALGKTVTISGLTITNGDYGICNGGTLTVSNCVISGNASSGVGNSTYNYGGTTFLTITNSIVSCNSGPGVVNSSHHGPAITRTVHSMSTCNSAGERPGGGGSVSLTIANSIVRDNSGVGASNGGSVAEATTTILNSTLSGNYADPSWGGGGGINTSGFEGMANVTVINSTISGNSAPQGAGGGIASDYSAVSIVNSTISGNSAYSGGGIANYSGGLEIANSTISGNSAADSGGGISNGGGVHIANSTLSGNSAGSGGGIYNVAGQYGASLEIGNTILRAGPQGENIFNNGGTVTSRGYNVSSDDGGGYLTGPGDQINTDPLLGPLQNNGGPTLTHALLPGSPAIDAGDPNFTPPPLYDQRGPCFVRVFDGRIDIGSVERQREPLPCTRPRPTPAPRPTPH